MHNILNWTQFPWISDPRLRSNCFMLLSLRWRHNDHAGVSNHQPHGCLLNRLFRRKSKKTSKLRVTGLCAGNSPGTGEFPAQMASYAENVSIWWRHHVRKLYMMDLRNWRHKGISSIIPDSDFRRYNAWYISYQWIYFIWIISRFSHN